MTSLGPENFPHRYRPRQRRQTSQPRQNGQGGPQATLTVKQPYDTQWKERVRTRIRRSDGVIALVSANSLTSTGQKWEIACAIEEGKPVRGIWAFSNDRTVLPSIKTLAWSDANISGFIDSL